MVKPLGMTRSWVLLCVRRREGHSLQPSHVHSVSAMTALMLFPSSGRESVSVYLALGKQCVMQPRKHCEGAGCGNGGVGELMKIDWQRWPSDGTASGRPGTLRRLQPVVDEQERRPEEGVTIAGIIKQCHLRLLQRPCLGLSVQKTGDVLI